MIKKTVEFDFQSNVEGESVKLSIDDSALAHIMSVLTDLYSDPELAVIREYSTNAYDAHVEAGNPSPIEVSLPTALAPFLRIRDYGNGLDAEDIRTIYSRYGTSTKRGTNDLVGMLGLGCKSALTYTNQFTLVGIKNGVRVQVSISRDEDGSGSMTILDESATDEASGVEVIIPTEDSDSIEETAREFFSYWTPGSVLVNGHEPKPFEGLRVSDTMTLVKGETPKIVMGNVAYPVPSEYHYSLIKDRHGLVAFVDIGAVDFTPSREALQLTAQTKETLHALKEELNANYKAALEALLNEAPNKYEAVKLSQELKGLIGSHKLSYKGTPIIDRIEAPANEPFVLVKRVKKYRQKDNSNEMTVYPATWLNAIWFKNYQAPAKSRITLTRNKKLSQWAEKNNITVEHFILAQNAPDPTWIDPTTVYDWAEVEAEVLPKVEKQVNLVSGKLAGSYEVYTQTGWKYDVPGDEISGRVILYYDPKYAYPPEKELLPKTTFSIVKLSPNRVSKFKRAFPKARSVREWELERKEKFEKSITEEQKLALLIQRESDGEFEDLDASRVDDPEVARYIRALEHLTPELEAGVNLHGIVYRDGDFKNPLAKYPLLTQRNSYATITEEVEDHMYIYLNAAYAAREAS